MHGLSSIFSTRRSPRASVSAFLLCVLVLTISGCSLLQKTGLLPKPAKVPVPVAAVEKPWQLQLDISGAQQLNPDTRSRPSPVQLRIFMSDGQSGINEMSFEQLFAAAGSEAPVSPLATVMLQPGQQRQLNLTVERSQTRLIIAAAFRDPYQTRWRAAADIQPLDIVSVQAHVDAGSVTISPSP